MMMAGDAGLKTERLPQWRISGDAGLKTQADLAGLGRDSESCSSWLGVCGQWSSGPGQGGRATLGNLNLKISGSLEGLQLGTVAASSLS